MKSPASPVQALGGMVVGVPGPDGQGNTEVAATMRRTLAPFLVVLVALTVVVASAGPALAAFEKGETISLGVGTIPSGYRVVWQSSINGYIGQGNPLNVSSLSVGKHTITVLIYRIWDNALAYRGTGTVEIVDSSNAAVTNPPATGSTYAPGEFEPTAEVLLGTADAYSVYDVYPEIVKGLRGAAPITIYVDNDYVRYDLVDIFADAGVSGGYTFKTTTLDSIWMRDYGPLFVKNGGKNEVVDLLYYPERYYDDRFPQRFATERGMTRRPLNVYMEGGNYTADGKGNIFVSDRVYEANNLTQSTVRDRIGTAFAGRTTVLEQMLDDGGTGHIDMFMLFTAPNSVLVNRFGSTHQNYGRMNRNVDKLAALGYGVTRIDLANTRYNSYSNGFVVNGTVLVPTYANAKDSTALATYRAAGLTTYAIDCRRIIRMAGAIHCITIAVPK